MKIALLGYGKMGQEIEKVALSKGHTIVLKVSSKNAEFKSTELNQADVAIEFSKPEFAVSNIIKCFEANVPVIVGTTGWYSSFEEVRSMCVSKKQSLVYATNFSIGVNLFFKLNQELAKLMNPHKEYKVEAEEIHHTQKLDAPSGTAISLAEQIIAETDHKNSWVNTESSREDELSIISRRIDEVPGTHSVYYKSTTDEIEIKHTAHNRSGFAGGAVLAAEWIVQKESGIYTMKDVLSF